MNRDIFRLIETKIAQMGTAGQKVGNTVLQDPQEVIHLSVSEMASLVGVSEATVVRFCQEIGYKGYQDFKINLSQSLVMPVKSLDSNIEIDDPPKILMEKICNTTIQTIEDTLGVIAEESLQQAIDLLKTANQVVCFGMGMSGIIAQDAQHKLMKLGIKVTAPNDLHNAIQSCSLLDCDDVLFVISYSGTTRDILKLVKLVKEQGIKVLAISRHAKTPLARLADVVLHTSSPESQYRSEGVCSRVAQLCIIDSLFVGVYVSDENRFSAALDRTRRALSDSRL